MPIVYTMTLNNIFRQETVPEYAHCVHYDSKHSTRLYLYNLQLLDPDEWRGTCLFIFLHFLNIFVLEFIYNLPISKCKTILILINIILRSMLVMLKGPERSNEPYVTKSYKIFGFQWKQFISFILVYWSRYHQIIL